MHGFRHSCPESVRGLQTEILRGDTGMMLLHQSGPTGFVIKEQKRRHPVKVHLGDRHTCSCTNFTMNSELCLHLCWTLLKKLKFEPEDPRSFQVTFCNMLATGIGMPRGPQCSLSDCGMSSKTVSYLGLACHDLSEHLADEKPTPTQPTRRRDAKRRPDDEPDDAVVESVVRRRVVMASDTCPICLEELLEKKAAVSHCRHGCGNAVHVACMRVVAHHQVQEAAVARRTPLLMLSCPLCRGEFCTPAQLAEEARNAPDVATPSAIVRRARAIRLKADAELAKLAEAVHEVSCACCAACPVVGMLYRCATCPDVRMCTACAVSPRSSRLHRTHGLVAKKRPEDGWHHVAHEEPAARRSNPARPKRAAVGVGAKAQLCCEGAGEEDGSQSCLRTGGEGGNLCLTGDVRTRHIRSGSKLLVPGQQCLLCLSPYKMKQSVGRLPCGHHFHARCLCEWLRTSSSCPLDDTPLQTKVPPPGDADALRLPKERASRSPASLCVRRLDLADRRDGSHSARSPSPKPSYLLHDDDVWTDADQVSKSRHAALPARPLGGQQRLLAGHPRRPIRANPPEEQVRRSPTHLSVRSLALPDDAGVGISVAAPCKTPAKEVRRRVRVSELTSERLRGLDLIAASDVGDLVDVKCLRMRLAERRLPK